MVKDLVLYFLAGTAVTVQSNYFIQSFQKQERHSKHYSSTGNEADNYNEVEFLTFDGVIQEYRRERWYPQRSEEVVQHLAPDGSLEFYKHFTNSQGMTTMVQIIPFDQLPNPGDVSWGTFDQFGAEIPSSYAASAGGIANTGCVNGRAGRDCSLMVAASPLVQEDIIGPDFRGARRSNQMSSRQNQRPIPSREQLRIDPDYYQNLNNNPRN